MKRWTFFVLLPIICLLLSLSVVAISSHAQTAYGTASPSDARTASSSDAWAASPSDARITSPSNLKPIQITNIEIGRYNINCIQLLLRGNSSDSLALQLEDDIRFYGGEEGLSQKDILFSIHYETKAFDQTYGEQTGLFLLKASIILEDDRYELAPEASPDFSIPVFLYDPDRPAFLPPLDPALNHASGKMEAFNIMAAVHTDLQQITDMLLHDYPYDRFDMYFENQYYLILPNAWDLSSVKTDNPGVYTAYRRPDLPQGILMEDVPRKTCSINIQDTHEFTLSSPTGPGNNIIVKWLYPTPDKSLFRTWYRRGNGDWMLDTEEHLMSLYLDAYGQYSLYLNTWEMKGDIRYQFRLEYDGVPSDVLEICVNEDGFYVPNEGDRDGGDRDDQSPPDVMQPPPEDSGAGNSGPGNSGPGNFTPENYTPENSMPENSISENSISENSIPRNSSQGSSDTDTSVLGFSPAEPKPVNNPADDSVAAISAQKTAGNKTHASSEPVNGMESDTATTTTWSGIRIRNYIEAFPGLPLMFEKNHIKVTVPADDPVILNISDTDLLYVEIQALSTDTILLNLNLNSVPLSGLPLTVITPWTGSSIPANLQIQNESGELTESVVNINQTSHNTLPDKALETFLISFTVTDPGVYTIVPSASEETMETDARPTDDSRQITDSTLAAAGIPSLLVLVAISVILFRYHKRKGE